MQNEAGELVDMYLPRKCSATSQLIHSRDHASIQIDIAEVEPENGLMTGKTVTLALCGMVRRMGESDDSINRLAKQHHVLPDNF